MISNHGNADLGFTEGHNLAIELSLTRSKDCNKSRNSLPSWLE